jgi:hypothetical protein
MSTSRLQISLRFIRATVSAIRDSAAWLDEATHNSGGGDATGNAAFAPRLPPKPCSSTGWVGPFRETHHLSELQLMGIAIAMPPWLTVLPFKFCKNSFKYTSDNVDVVRNYRSES